jgi:hypothetical protein
MGIKSIQGGGTVATGTGVSYVRLASLRGMLRMEKVGMKSRGGALRPKIAAEFGLSARASYDDFINAVQKKMEELAPIVQEENKAEMLSGN